MVHIRQFDKNILKLVGPAVGEQILAMIVGVISMAFVGHIGTSAVSGVGLVNTFIGFVMVVFVAINTGSTIVIARQIGEGDRQGAVSVVRHAVIFGFVIAIIVGSLAYIYAPNLINLFFGGADSLVQENAILYFKITMISLPLLLINLVISGCLRGTGDTRTPMLIAFIVNILTVVLSLILIFPFKIGSIHLPGFDLLGAAWSVAIARGFGGFISLLVFHFRKDGLRVNLFAPFQVQWTILKRMLRIGMPAMLEQIIMQGGFLLLQVVISGMGTSSIAIYQIALSISSICFIPIWGFGIAASCLIGQSLGAQKPKTAELIGWRTLRYAQVVTIFMTLAIVIFVHPLLLIYTKDPHVLQLGVTMIRIFCFSQPFLTMVVVFSGALRGAGDIYYVTVTSFVGIWGMRLLLSWFLGVFLNLGILGVFIAYNLDFASRALMYTFRYKRGKWKVKEV